MNLNLEITDDGTVPSSFIAALNDRMRQINSALKTLNAVTPAATTLQGLHSARLTENAAKLAQGTQFWETDRHVTYIVQAMGSVGTWAYLSGTDSDVLANRPTDLGKYDDGFVFFATDTHATSVWSGSTSKWSS